MANKHDHENIENLLKNKKAEGRDTIVTNSTWMQPNKKMFIPVFVSEHPKSHFSEYHTHSFFEINYVCRGSGVNFIENDMIDMHEGDAIIMRPGTFHTLYCDDDSIIYNFIVDKDWFCREVKAILELDDNRLFDFLNKLESDDFYKYAVCPSNGSGRVNEAAVKLISCFGDRSFSRFIMTEAAMLEFLAVLIENSEKAYLSNIVGAKDSKIISILMYTAENYNTVTLEELSEKFFYSKTHICRLFLAHTGKSFNQSLMQMKINHACKYLKHTEMSVEDISHVVGYDSVEYFQRLFKKKIGITPGEFRKNGVVDNLLC